MKPAAAPSADERRDWLRLARTETVGPTSFAYLIGRYGSARRALARLPDLTSRGGRAGAPRIPSAADAERELEAGAALGARLLTSADSDFPVALGALDPPPPVIWARGDVTLMQKPCIAMVGSRGASAAGRRFAREIAADLGRAGWVVVSGLARGIDAAAHQGSLATGAVAVVAGGVDDVYPPEHHALYDEIAARGCVVSERPVGHGARAKDFPRRNRIVSGLARGVIVVEAELKSGSLITARFAAEQGREVFAVPGSPADPRSKGVNDLIRQGATLVEDAEDVLRVLTELPRLDHARPDRAPPRDDRRADAEAEPKADTEGLGAILEQMLSPAPTSLDQLARATGAPLPVVLAALTELSLAGRAELMPGGLASRA
jgi:DNA processing protein